MARRLLVLAVLLAVVIGVGINLGWQWVGAPLLGYAVYRFVIGNLRGLVHAGRMGAPAEDEVVEGGPRPPDGRTLFWCEECGTEVLLLVRGTTRPTSHCGQRMHERTEVVRD